MEQKIGHENSVLLGGFLERLRDVAHVEVLPRIIDLFPKSARGKAHHLPGQTLRVFVLPRPQPVDGWGLVEETAVLVLASAGADTRIVSADFLVGMEGHNVATLPRAACGKQDGRGSSVAGMWWLAVEFL